MFNIINPFYALVMSLITTIFVSGYFFVFCFKGNVFNRFGRVALSWLELLLLSLIAFLPMCSFFSTLYLAEKAAISGNMVLVVLSGVFSILISKLIMSYFLDFFIEIENKNYTDDNNFYKISK